jgi:hypothetical protein
LTALPLTALPADADVAAGLEREVDDEAVVKQGRALDEAERADKRAPVGADTCAEGAGTE